MATATEPERRSSNRLQVQQNLGAVERQTKELRALLRSRLLIACGVMFGFWAALPIGSLRHMYDPGQPALVADALIFQFTIGFAIGLVGVVIWLRPPEKLETLRFLELVVFGAGFLILAVTNWYFIQRFGLAAPPIAPVRHPVVDMGGTRMDPATLRWMVFIVGYGTIIPNTIRRVSWIVLFIALSYVAMAVTQGLIAGVTAREMPNLMLYPTMWMLVSCVIAIFGSYRVSILQRRVEDIEKFGQYRLQKLIGRGGMGDVWLAEHVLLKQPFAVKMLNPDKLTDARQLARFEREVQAMARLEHWNTVEIYDYGHSADGTFYYVMEYLPGFTLEELVWKAGPLPAARAIYFLRQICSALVEAHRHGLLHRDIKPANVIVSERAGIYDVAKLTDFGLVKHFEDPSDTKLTMEGYIMGTPAYMSPEHAAGQERVDARSDIYSLGALGYFLLSRRPPFENRTATQVLAAHMYEEPRPLSTWRPDAPPSLLDIIHKCMAKKPADRFASAAELKEALSACDTCGVWSQSDAAQWWKKHYVEF
ncbi:MAG TPA: serine/threonine-protein kinase [Gemmatimonadaceae bacterium]